MTTAPARVPIPGEIVGTPPYRAEGCIMQVLLLDGDQAAQQDLCDRLLVQPSGGALTFKVLSGKVLLSAVYVETMRSLDPQDSDKGVIREWDIGFWTCVAGGITSQPSSWSIYWVPSFLFVDTGSAMAAGREIFGYPKTVAEWQRGPVTPEDGAVSLRVLHYPCFGPTKRPKLETLLSVQGASRAGEDSAALLLDAGFWNTSGLPGEVLAEMDGPVPRALTNMDQLMLRQVSDARAPDRASLQAATVVSIRTDGLSGAGRIPGQWELSLTASASHPIADTLGLPAKSTTQHAYWVRQDFTVPAARYLWQAS